MSAKLHKVSKIPQKHKDTVYGFLRHSQRLLPANKAYYNITELIKHLCLLYFHRSIESSILTEQEESDFFALLSSNAKSIIDLEWKLVFRLSKEISLNDPDIGNKAEELFVRKVHGKANIVVFVHTTCDNVFGGYTSTGWDARKERNRSYSRDEHAFVFSVRSNKGWSMALSNVKQQEADSAMAYCDGCFLNFGSTWVFYYNGGVLRHQNPSNYEEFPKDHYLLGGKHMSRVHEIEAFQLE